MYTIKHIGMVLLGARDVGSVGEVSEESERRRRGGGVYGSRNGGGAAYVTRSAN